MGRRWPLSEPPDLFQTLDHRAYLAAWFSWKKLVNPRFSHRVFARLAGVRSPSLLLLVMQGKRNLTSQTLEGVCRAMSLDHEEQEYLAALVDLDAAQTPEEKSRVFIRLSAMRRFQAARRIEGEGFRYLSVWYLPAIRELAACAQFRADPAWVAEQLRPQITVAEAEEGLALLVRLGMLVADVDGRLRPADVSLVSDLLTQLQPHLIYAAGDLNDPHGTHRLCLRILRDAFGQAATARAPWLAAAELWLYRGAWNDWPVDEIDLAVPLSPQEVLRRRRAIFRHETQKDQALFLGEDRREFWQRTEDRSRRLAEAYNTLGLAEYEAIEAFKRYAPEDFLRSSAF